MKTVPLYGEKAAGRVALVDDEDYELVMQFRWTAANPSADCWYPIANIRRPGRGTVLMHQLLTGWSLTDHKNHNGLDNRRSNLRPATRGQNLANQRKCRSSGSLYKGVSFMAKTGRWRGRIKIGGKTIHLGVFATEVEAARAYDTAALSAWGAYAYPNLPSAETPAAR